METLLIKSLASELILGVNFPAKLDICSNFYKRTYEFGVQPTTCTIVDEGALSKAEKKALEALTMEYFKESKDMLGATNAIVHKIETGDAEPVKQKYYPVSPNIQKFINEELDEMLR